MLQQTTNKLIIGSYPYRGNVNICRMCCEYTGIQYQNQFFNPYSWKQYKQKNTQNWIFPQLPFLIDGDTVVTQIYPMCQYVIKKSGHSQLLGKNPEDAFVIDGFLWGKDLIQSLLSLVVQCKNDPKRLMQQMNSSWIKATRNHLIQYQKNAQNNFYLGYLTIIDFIIHQIFEHFKEIFRKQIGSFPKLVCIREKVASLNKIKQFQNSKKTVVQKCPVQFYKKWKVQMMKSGQVPIHCQNSIAQ